MTAQILKNDTMQAISGDAAFLLRWLNGTLSEEELSALRNREEYEKLVSSDKPAIERLSEKRPSGKNTSDTNQSVRVKTVDFSGFVPVVVAMALSLIALAYMKLIGL